MRILYDGYIYHAQNVGGINRYFANLINRLPDTDMPVLTTSDIHEINYPMHPRLQVKRFPSDIIRSWRLTKWLEPRYYQLISDLGHYNIAHPTYYNQLTRRSLSDNHCPVVLTVYDMIHERFADQMDPHGLVAETKRKAIFAAQAIICISQSTRNDLLEMYPVLEDRVHVTYLASEIDESMTHGAEPTPARPYFLYVGNRGGYKNFLRFLLAFSHIASNCKDAILCIVGCPFNRTEVDCITALDLADRVEYMGHISDSHLAKLYRCALAFVYPSLYEGFGIPPLEAMACGCVVVASDCSSIPEVVGEAGIMFNPYSVDELADILQSLYNNRIQRERLIANGRARAQSFTWAKTAEQTFAIYKALAC